MKIALKICLAFLTILTLSCKKEESELTKKMDLLTKSVWFVEKIEQKMPNGNWVDATNTITPEQADNVLIFRKDTSYEINEGPIKLPANPQLITIGLWEFIDGGNTIFYSTGKIAAINLLSETHLQLTNAATDTSFEERITYKH